MCSSVSLKLFELSLFAYFFCKLNTAYVWTTCISNLRLIICFQSSVLQNDVLHKKMIFINFRQMYGLFLCFYFSVQLIDSEGCSAKIHVQLRALPES